MTFSPYGALRFEKNPVVRLETPRGAFEVECFADQAPIHVANFVGHVKAGFYDGKGWHRVVPNFVVQGGDSEGNGSGSSPFSLRAEINESRYERGTLGMPRGSDFDSGDTQLFLTHLPTPHLDGLYTVFGKVRRGIDTLDRIEPSDPILKATIVD